jgi:hypothetical protein
LGEQSSFPGDALLEFHEGSLVVRGLGGGLVGLL